MSSLLFLHIPKTAGTTLKGIITRQYPGERLYVIGQDVIGSIARFRTRAVSDYARTNIIQGHMSFGLHRFMHPPFSYITILRDPIGRSISDYAFVTSTPQHPLYNSVHEMSFGEYMTSGATGQLSNGQTRLLCGDCEGENYGVPTKRHLENRDLETAQQNLKDHFMVVGLQEQFDETLILMRRTLGWSYPYYFRENVTRRIMSEHDLTPEDLDIVKAQNTLDRALYDNAAAAFNAEVRDLGDPFQRDLATFQLLNRAFRGAVRLRARLPAALGRMLHRRPRQT